MIDRYDDPSFPANACMAPILRWTDTGYPTTEADGRSMHWNTYCDFDGTIASEDVTDNLLRRFASPDWLDIEDEWKAGVIGSGECMARQVALIRADKIALDAHLDAVEIDRAFADFVRFCHSRGVPLTVVSDGLDYAIRRILGRHGLGSLTIVANRLRQIGEERYALDFPFAREDCRTASGTCKCHVAGGGEKHRRRLLIGDGASDFCTAAAVDLVFAKQSLLAHCQRHRLPHVACRDFAEAKRLLQGLIEIGLGNEHVVPMHPLEGSTHD